MILSEWAVGTKRNRRTKTARRSGQNALFSTWCGRRDLNPHSYRKRILSPHISQSFQRICRQIRGLCRYPAHLVGLEHVGMDATPTGASTIQCFQRVILAWVGIGFVEIAAAFSLKANLLAVEEGRN